MPELRPLETIALAILDDIVGGLDRKTIELINQVKNNPNLDPKASIKSILRNSQR